jgi:Ca-activated chloride channel homolog
MIRHPFAHPHLLFALTALPVLGLLAWWARRRRQRALLCFAGLSALGAVRTHRRWPRALRRFFLLGGLTCLGVGLAGPQWGRDWGQAIAPGRDLVVVLDTSRSMFAEEPSRLARARAALLELTEALRRRGGGYRLGLVTFAGVPRLTCPLTHDYDLFRDAVEGVDLLQPDPALKPDSDPSGTRIGAALELAVKAHDTREEFRVARDVLLLSDGDDPARDGEWDAGAEAARAEGIPVHAVGLGDPDRGHPIPFADGWLSPGGKEVRTRLEEAPLREIARKTGGTFLPARTRSLPLGEHYLGLIASEPLREVSADALPVYRQRYPWFLLPAFVLLAATLLLPERLRAARPAPSPPR